VIGVTGADLSKMRAVPLIAKDAPSRR